jgi:hypothetical protein
MVGGGLRRVEKIRHPIGGGGDVARKLVTPWFKRGARGYRNYHIMWRIQGRPDVNPTNPPSGCL